MADSLPTSSLPPEAEQAWPLDLGETQVRYVNFCRVMGTPEELILDLGMQTAEHALDPVWEAPQRITVNFITAKRLLQALDATLRQYETTFGHLETEVEKRVTAQNR